MASPVQPVNTIRFFKPDEQTNVSYTFAIIVSRYREQWIWVKHRERNTWELPAGHLESGETPMEAARRELYEETGALEFTIDPVVSYEGTYQGKPVFGMIFLAEVYETGPLPDFEIAGTELFSEIPEPLTYPQIQPAFFRYVLEYLNTSNR